METEGKKTTGFDPSHEPVIEMGGISSKTDAESYVRMIEAYQTEPIKALLKKVKGISVTGVFKKKSPIKLSDFNAFCKNAANIFGVSLLNSTFKRTPNAKDKISITFSLLPGETLNDSWREVLSSEKQKLVQKGVIEIIPKEIYEGIEVIDEDPLSFLNEI